MSVPATLSDTLALLKGAKNQFGKNAGRPVGLKEGKTKVRILKFVQNGNAAFWRTVGQHWIKPEEKAKPVAVCGSINVTYDGKNAAGEMVEDLVSAAVEMAVNRAGNDDEVKLYKSWRSRNFVLVIAIILDGPDAAPEPKILQLSGGAFHDFLAIAETYAEASIDIFSPTTGYDVVFERRGKMLDTEYTVMAAPAPRPFDPKLLERVPDIDAYIAKEFFRQGDDRKALTAIATIAGISLSSLGGGGAPAIAPPRAAGALSGTAAKLAELSAPAPAPVAPAPAPVAPVPVAPVAPVAPPAPPAPAADAIDDEEAALMAQLEAARQRKAAAAAAAAAPVAPAPVAPVAPAAPADDFGAAIDADDLAATLAELDKL